MKSRKTIMGPSIIEAKIFMVPGHKVMLDSDLAMLYQVSTKALVQAVKRNIKRFPPDFMFQLRRGEFARGGRRYAPYAFTEHGVARLSSVLNSERAIHVN